MGALNSLAQVFNSNIKPDKVTPAGGWVDHRALAANTHESHAIPTGANYVRVSVSVNTYINIGGTATVPADITDGTSSILVVNAVPRVFYLGAATAIGLIASATALVCLEFHS